MASQLPELERLTVGLNSVLSNNGSHGGGVKVLARKPNRYESTFPSEIVTCRLNASRDLLHLFCKYGTRKFDSAYGHRGGVSYEADVYRNVLVPLRTSTPTFYGAYREEKSGEPWLIIEYLKGASRDASKTNEAVSHGARWIGRFHASNEKRLRNSSIGFLHRYDARYYRGWARRTKKLFADRKAELSWLPRVCTNFEELIPELLTAPKTIIHGEYYATNIVYQNGISRPADWQSAAVAVGEIDLAALTQNWPRQTVEKLRRQYQRARWPHGEPGHFDRVFRISRVYMTLRWLGDPALVSPSFKRLIFSKKSRNLPLRSRNHVNSYRKFIHELHWEGKSLGLE